MERRRIYVAKCLNVEVNSFGKTKEEALANLLANLQEAIELYFENIPLTDATQIENPEIILTELEHA